MSKYYLKTANLGYPRLGEKREWKKLLESFWENKISEEEFLIEQKKLRLSYLKKQKDLNIDFIPIGDFSFYDHVLDLSVSLGIIPKRFNFDKEALTSLKTYFSIARGNKDNTASEMTKWFNTNYHYIVPELDDINPSLVENKLLKYYKEAKDELNIEAKPVILSLVSYLKLGKKYSNNNTSCSCCNKNDSLEKIHEKDFNLILPIYLELIKELVNEGVKLIQIDEPVLVTDFNEKEFKYLEILYNEIKKISKDTKIIIQTYFDSVNNYEQVIKLPVDGIGLDFVNDHKENYENIIKYGFPKDKILFAGIINGRNIWRSNLNDKVIFINKLLKYVDSNRLVIQPSNSLLHVPVTKKTEKKLDELIYNGLSFADEKLEEINILKEFFNNGSDDILKKIKESKSTVKELNKSSLRNNKEVKKEISNLKKLVNERKSPFNVRIKKQKEFFKLPILPTTTIGSFPQSLDVRVKRAKFLKNEISSKDYEDFIKYETKRWIKIQEDLDIDVLVHGEFERNDMVEFFGEKLSGFITTKYGWVQSYGSRAVKPPIIYGDVSFIEPITVKETVYAQSLTNRIVKGMLTAPITIINWSFVRDDISKEEVGNQIGLALRKEVLELEKQGIKIIQVDEPALREGLPLQKKRWDKYLNDAVYSFKLTTTGVKDETQVHTHMCYSNFDDIIETISNLDADVISIEASRSHGEIISTFEHYNYDKEIGLGVYDIHSPRIPSVEEIETNIKRALEVIPYNNFWINPDCGLKTRKEKEVIDSLKNLVIATKNIRERLK